MFQNVYPRARPKGKQTKCSWMNKSALWMVNNPSARCVGGDAETKRAREQCTWLIGLRQISRATLVRAHQRTTLKCPKIQLYQFWCKITYIVGMDLYIRVLPLRGPKAELVVEKLQAGFNFNKFQLFIVVQRRVFSSWNSRIFHNITTSAAYISWMGSFNLNSSQTTLCFSHTRRSKADSVRA